jgi:hypothetical protein
MNTKEIGAVATYIANWWTERLEQGDKEAFRSYIHRYVADNLAASPGRPYLSLECDYDPLGPLLEAVHAAGVECEGYSFSADGILPRKHSTDIYPDPARLITVEDERRNEPIPLSEISEHRHELPPP